SFQLKKVGEERIVRFLEEIIDKSNILGSNEDAVAQEWDGSILVANTDAISWESDILPNMTPFQIGKKVVSITVSDLAAKGAVPRIFMSSINLPSTEKLNVLLGIVNGMKEAAHFYGMKYLGGDLGTASEGVIAGFAIGFLSKGQILRRDGAKEADYVCITGKIGQTGVVINQIYQNKPLSALNPKWLNKLMEPTARAMEGRILSESGLVNASIDSSDGLAKSLWELASQSQKRIIITDLPVDKSIVDYATQNDLNLIDLVFYGGEEYELICCVPSNSFQLLRQKIVTLGSGFEKIGYITKGKGEVYLEKEGELIKLQRKGWWDTFASPFDT
ncbi:MAG: thiamine-phosphate kinase, partial [Candidatus Hodarchaeota archaeon]